MNKEPFFSSPMVGRNWFYDTYHQAANYQQETRQFIYRQAYTDLDGMYGEEFIYGRVMAWFLDFYRNFSRNIVEATAEEKPFHLFGVHHVYQIVVFVRGTEIELQRIEAWVEMHRR